MTTHHLLCSEKETKWVRADVWHNGPLNILLSFRRLDEPFKEFQVRVLERLEHTNHNLTRAHRNTHDDLELWYGGKAIDAFTFNQFDKENTHGNR
jgi:hypothetical protein